MVLTRRREGRTVVRRRGSSVQTRVSVRRVEGAGAVAIGLLLLLVLVLLLLMRRMNRNSTSLPSKLLRTLPRRNNHRRGKRSRRVVGSTSSVNPILVPHQPQIDQPVQSIPETLPLLSHLPRRRNQAPSRSNDGRSKNEVHSSRVGIAAVDVET